MLPNRKRSSIADEVLDNFYTKLHLREQQLRRRSKGIVDVRVTYKPQCLYIQDVILHDRRDEYTLVQYMGRYPLTHESGNTYSAKFPVPRAGEVTIRVRLSGKSVWVNSPGQGWASNGQVGKYTEEERSNGTVCQDTSEAAAKLAEAQLCIDDWPRYQAGE